MGNSLKMITLIINQKQQHMKKLIFLMVALVSFGMMAQDSKAYLALNVGASFPGGDITTDTDISTGLDFNLNLGYRFTEAWGATATWGASAFAFEDGAGDTAAFGAGYLGLGPMYTLALGDNLAWDIKPQYLFGLSGLYDFEGGSDDVTYKGSGWMLGQSFVLGFDQGFKIALNIDYLSGKYTEAEFGGETIGIDSDNAYSHFTIGVGARYNF